MMENPHSSSSTADESSNNAENQSHEAEAPVDFKISPIKILKVNANDKNLEFNSKNENLSILHVDNCQNFEDAQKIVKYLNFQNTPNIFAFVVEVKNESIKGFEKLQAELIGKIKTNHPLVLQVSNINSKKIYIKKNDKLVQLNLNLARESLIEQLEQSIFTVESLFNILKLKNCSIVDANLSEIKEFLKLPHIDHKLFNFALNQRDELCFRLLQLFNVNFPQEIQAKILNAAISTKSFHLFLAYFNKFNPYDVKKVEIERILPLNIFLTSIECRNFKVVKFLLKFSKYFTGFFNFSLWRSAWELAIKREYFDICNELQNADFTFTKDENIVKKNSKVKYEEILTKIANFHENIFRENLNEVKKLAESYPNLRLCYGSRRMCALEWAITCKKIEIFAFLRSKGFYTDKSEQLWNKIEQLTEDEKIEIRDENLKYTISDPDAFIGILLSKCSFDASSSLHFEDIRQMLVELAKIKQFRPVMEIVAMSDVKIIFDFKTESVRSMDPTRDEYHMGIAYFTREILYVGRNSNKNQRYGTFAHEMTHLALYLVYENKCLPYCEGDKEREAKWVEVVKDTKRVYENDPEGTDNIIKWVFICYDEGYEQNAEAIVRVNDLLAFYFGNPAKIQELRRVFFRLFDFYDNFTLADLDPERFRLKNLNNDFGLLTSTLQDQVKLDLCNKLLIQSNVPHLSIFKLQHDLEQKSSNSFFFKFENIFISLKKLCAMNESNERLLNSEKVKRVVIDASECNAEDLIRINIKLRAGVEYFVVVYKNLNLSLPGFQNISEVYEWQNLDVKSKKYLLKKEVYFQGMPKPLSSLLPESRITSEVLSELYKNKEISINCHNLNASSEIFIQRKLQKKQGTFELSLDEFIDLFQNQNKMLISDLAGSGKTFVLKKIRGKLIARFSDNLVVYANFRDFSVDLVNEDFKDFQSFICEKILKLESALNVAVFNHFYTENRVIVLLDGFDEVSHVAKENAIKLIKMHNHGKLLVTTRDYFEENLKIAMNVTSFSLIPYNSLDQTQFIEESWRKNTKFQNELIKKCAGFLIARLNMILSRSAVSFLGLPLILNIFVEFFKSDLSDNFDKFLDQTLKISNAYDELVKSKTNFWSSIRSLEDSKFHFNSITLKFLYYYLALKLPHKNKKDFVFDINYVTSEWNLEEISKAGIIRIDQDGKVGFIHETVAEYFVSDFIKIKLMHIDVGWKFFDEFISLLFQILTDERFKIVRFFLNETIHEVDTSTEGFKCLKNKFESKLKEDQKSGEIFVKCKEESTYNLAFFFTSSISSLDAGQIFLSFVSDQTKKSPEEIEFFFSHIFKLKRNTLMKIFFLPDAEGFPRFFRIFLDSYEQFLKHLKEKNFSKKERSMFLLHKTVNDENILHFAVLSNKNEKSVEFLVSFVKIEIGSDEIKKMLSKFNSFNHLPLHCAIRFNNLNLFKFFFSLYEISFKKEQILKFLQSIDEKGDNFLHLAAAFSKFEEVFEFAWLKIETLIENKEELKNYLLVKGEFETNALLLSIGYQNENSFYFLFEEVFCKVFKIEEFAYKTDQDGDIILHYLAKFGSVSMLKFTLEKLKDEFSSEGFHNIIKLKNNICQNLLHCAAVQNKNVKSVEFLVDFLENEVGTEEITKLLIELDDFNRLPLHCAVEFNNVQILEFFFSIYVKNFNQIKILDFIRAKDKNCNNFLHCAAAFAKSKEVFEFAWLQIERLFKDREEIKEFLLLKGEFERNALLKSIADQNENSFYFLYEEIFWKFLNTKEFACDTDEDSENLLHYLARRGSVSMLKFALKKLKDDFSPGDFQNFIKMKTKNGENLLHCVAQQNKNEMPVEFFVDFLDNEVGKKRIRKMLSELDDFKRIPLYCAVECNNLNVLKLFFSLYEKFFTKYELTKKFFNKDSNFRKKFELAHSKAVDKKKFEAFKRNFSNYEDVQQKRGFFSKF